MNAIARLFTYRRCFFLFLAALLLLGWFSRAPAQEWEYIGPYNAWVTGGGMDEVESMVWTGD